MARRSNGTNLNIAQLEQILGSRRSELNKLYKQRSDLQKKLDGVERQITQMEGGAGRGGRRGGGKRARNERSLIETIEAVLEKAGRPMKVLELVEAVQATGYKSNSANFRGIVNQTLIKDKRFTAAQRGLYQLKGGKTKG